MRCVAWACVLLSGLALPATAADPAALTYRGLCEASAAASLDETHFVVASDETNIFRVYARGQTTVGTASDLRIPTGFDKSDIEAAARIGDRVYWSSSHSLTKGGNDKAERKVFFATGIHSENGEWKLEMIGSVASLQEPLLGATGFEKADLNIEGLAATSEGELLIGLRNTKDDKALIIPFRNPADVVDSGSAPDFGEPITLDLKGKGVRSLELVGDGYFILAGSPPDAGEFAMYSWEGPGSQPILIVGIPLEGMTPEAMALAGTSTLLILSDDGDRCAGKDDDPESPADQRTFQSIEVAP